MNKKNRKLSLNRETLAPLTSDDLNDVNGGVVTPVGPSVQLSLRYCSQIVNSVKQTAQEISRRICPSGGGAGPQAQ